MIQRCADKDRLQVMMTALNKYCRNSNKSEDRVYHIEEGIGTNLEFKNTK